MTFLVVLVGIRWLWLRNLPLSDRTLNKIPGGIFNTQLRYVTVKDFITLLSIIIMHAVIFGTICYFATREICNVILVCCFSSLWVKRLVEQKERSLMMILFSWKRLELHYLLICASINACTLQVHFCSIETSSRVTLYWIGATVVKFYVLRLDIT